MSEKSQQIADEHRRHNQKVAQLRAEYVPGRLIDDEYQHHMRRLDEILGPGEETIVNGRRTV